MSWRFRRSIQLAPGIRWNIGKKSSSISIGPRGAKLTTGTHGTRVTAGLPGSGVFFTQKLGGATVSQPAVSAGESTPSSMSWYPLLAWLSVFAFIGGFIVGPQLFFVSLGLGVLWLILRTKVAEQVDAQQTAGVKAETVEQENLAQIARFRGEFAMVRENPTKAGYEALLARREELALSTMDVPNELAVIEASIALLTLRETIEQTGKFPVLDGHAAIVGDDTCHFVERAFVDERGEARDENASVYLTAGRCVLHGSSLRSIPWSRVATVVREGSNLTIQRNDRVHPFTLQFESLSAAVRAGVIAAALQSAHVSPDDATPNQRVLTFTPRHFTVE